MGRPPSVVVKPAHRLCALQFKIEPFKYPVKMDPNFAGRLLANSCSTRGTLTVLPASHTPVAAEKTWAVLESAIHEIFNQNQSGLSFEELYR